MPNVCSESPVGSPQLLNKRACDHAHPRVVIMGASGVGKTSLVERFLYERFPLDHVPTVEELHVNVYEVAGGATLTLDLLDTSGSYEFPAMRRLAIQAADAIVLVYSVADRDSFGYVSSLRELILEVRSEDRETVPIVVVGNKSDLESAVSRELVELVATVDWEHGFVECSAKENVNVLKVFSAVLQQAHICYALGQAVERRRKSLPSPRPRHAKGAALGAHQKRHSCAMQ